MSYDTWSSQVVFDRLGRVVCARHGFTRDWCPYPDCIHSSKLDIRRNSRGELVKRQRVFYRKTGKTIYRWYPTKEPLLRLVENEEAE